MTFTIEELNLIQTALELKHRNHLYKKNMEKVVQIDKIVNKIVDYKSQTLHKM